MLVFESPATNGRSRLYFKTLDLQKRSDQLDKEVAVSSWIIPEFQRLISSVEAPAGDPSSSTAVPELVKSNVVTHDEKRGGLLIDQQTFKNEAAQKSIQADVPLPWRRWMSPEFVSASHQGKEDADLSSVVTALSHLHEFSEVNKQKVDVLQEMLKDSNGKDVKGRFKVVTTEKTEQGEIMLPPCVMKGHRLVVAKTENPHAVQVRVDTCKARPQADVVLPPTVSTAKKPNAAKITPAVAESRPEQTKLRSRAVHINPEFSAPAYKGVVPPPTGDPSSSTCQEGVTAWKWSYDHSESMHPFWAVQRRNKTEMAALQAQADKDAADPAVAAKLKPRFNTGIKEQSHSQVFLSPNGLSSSKVVTIPFITNTMELEKGEELYLEVKDPKAKVEEKEMTWQKKRKCALLQQSQEKAKQQKAALAGSA